MFKFLILLFIATNVLAHGGAKPPIDSTNTIGTSHSGFGNYGDNDYEASEKLRKSCLLQDRVDRYSSLACHYKSEMGTKEFNSFLSTGSKAMMTHKIRAYAASVLSDEAINIDPKSRSLKGCGGTTIKPPPHKKIRKKALSLDNAVSASLLYSMFASEQEDYARRIKMNYPYLLKPSNKTGEILEIIEDELGELYSDDGGMHDHGMTMKALKAQFAIDPAFKKKIKDKVASIQKSYKDHVSKQADSVCSESIDSIMSKYPAVFDQFLIDLPDNERDVADYILCKNKKYYDPESFDSDCDGVVDSEDSNPSYPFEPNNEITPSQGSYKNPPFSNEAEYKMKANGSKISLDADIFLTYGNLNESEKRLAISNIKTCAAKAKYKIEALFKKLEKINPAFKGKTLEATFNVKEAGFFDSSSFTVHKCWCSTCKVRTDDGYLWDTYIPKDTCEEDFTQEMKDALTDKELNPQGARWFSQADAGNLTYQSTTNCKTIVHEFYHKLGLPDEYTADYYPFNHIGEHDSIMRNGEKLYLRQLSSVLSPKACKMRKGNYDL